MTACHTRFFASVCAGIVLAGGYLILSIPVQAHPLLEPRPDSAQATMAAAAMPATAKPPEGKGKSKTAFTIKATLVQYPWSFGWEGDFAATGAIKDGGEAFYVYAFGSTTGSLTLYGEKGNISISIWGSTFEVRSGTGAYANLQASGSVRERFRKVNRLSLTLEGTVVGW
jgi:hypothetical protein